MILTYAMNWSFSAFSWSAILACCLIQRSSSCWLSCSTFLYFSSRPVYVSCKAWCSSFNIYKQREKTISQSNRNKIKTFSTQKNNLIWVNNSNKQKKKTINNWFNPHSVWDIFLAPCRVIKLRKAHPWAQSFTTKEHVVENRSKDQKLAHLLSFYGPAACCHARKTET